ncbi:MAG: PA14 domain-containing protein [Planctomycetota bacterium]
MWKNASILIVIASMLVFSGAAQAARDVTSPQDIVVAVPDDGDWPPNELPPFAVDDQILTKYLHFKGFQQPTGFRVTPVMGPTVVTGLTFTTANDAVERDPVSYELSGSNDSINGPYTLIAEGPIVDFAAAVAWPRRTKNTTPIQFANTVSYKHYQVLFTAVRTPTSANSMQIAEVELLTPTYKAEAPTPADGAVHADTWVNLSWTPGEAAVSHDVYFSDNRADVESGAADAFQGNQTSTFLVAGFPGFPYPEGLVPGTTYYWRIDEINNSHPDSPWVGDVWSFTVPSYEAWRPVPADGAKYVDPDTDLSWNSGWGGRLHTVYFGDNFDDVNNATGGVPQIPTTYALDTLEMNKTYYWRVDEFTGAVTYKGHVWSFTTTSGEGGIKGEYFNNTILSGDPVLVRIDPAVDFDWGASGPGAPLPDNGWSARWTADLIVSIADTFTFSVNSEGGTRLWIDDKLVIDVWASWVPTKYASQPMRLDSGIHSLRLEFADWDRNASQRLTWSTPTMAEEIIAAGPLQPPYLARRPIPLDGTVGVNLMSDLRWKAGYAATSHEVYFGTDADAVANATTASPEYKGSKALGEESLDPGTLGLNETYYWRVDEVNNLDPSSPWTGNVWTFNTGDFLVVEDFESYNDIDPPAEGSNRIFDAWIDGFGTTTNGAIVGNDLPPYAEQHILHGGGQSMIYRYDNANMTSEATLTLVYPRDWTADGVTKLALWFRGASTNSAEKMFVALNGTAVASHDAPDATQQLGWNEWVIDLAAFAGVDLTNVNTITIGIGTKNSPAAGGAGTMYFDDIRLIR